MFDVSNKTKTKPPIGGLVVERIKDKILGKKYEFSLVIIGDKTSKDLNSKYRKKDRVANILSFPLSKTNGEIFLNVSRIKKEAEKYKINYKIYFSYLLIHSLLHLKGYDHGLKMSQREKYFLNKLEIPLEKNLRKFL